jgi:hypothetical protein
MILRLQRNKRTADDLGLIGHGGLNVLFDDTFKSGYRLTDEEYDFFCDQDEEKLDVLITRKDNYTFNDKREILLALQYLMTKFIESKNGNNN